MTKSIPNFADGILSMPQLKQAFEAGIISADAPLLEGQLQPASLDLRLGARAWRVQASFLPGQGECVKDKLDGLSMHEIDLRGGAVLEKGCVYIAEIMEGLNLPENITGLANPKSSTGRLDVFTRLIVEEVDKADKIEFEMVPSGYSGRLYAEISPRTFSIWARQGSRLSQLRLRVHNEVRENEEGTMDHLVRGGVPPLMAWQISQRTTINNSTNYGINLSVNLSEVAHPQISGLIGWRARKYAGMIDVDKVGEYEIAAFWEPVTRDHLTADGLVLNPDEFYILASREYVTVPAEYAAEMTAYDTRIGEFRAHYAGFFDPGFGAAEYGAGATRAVLEVRSHDVPFFIEERQTVCRLFYEPLSLVPDTLYGAEGGGSHYQAQGLKLSKHFKAPEAGDGK